MVQRYPRWGRVFYGKSRLYLVRLQWKYLSYHERVLYKNRRKTGMRQRRLSSGNGWRDVR